MAHGVHPRAALSRSPGSCFVSGMAPDDGEPLAVLALVHALRALGLTVTAMTPLVADATHHAGRWMSPSLDRLSRAGSFGLPAAALSPYVLPRAATPAQAVAQAGAHVEARAVAETYQVLSTWADVVVVEGVGGLDERLGPSLAVHGVAAHLDLPLVLALRPDPGAPKRAERALALAHEHRMRIAGWVATGVTPDGEGMLSLLRERLQMPLLGLLPMDARDGAQAAAHLDGRALCRALEVPPQKGKP